MTGKAVAIVVLSLVLGHLYSGVKLYEEGKYEDAYKQFNSIIMNYGENPYTDDAHYWAAKCQLALKNEQKAKEHLNIVIQKYKDREHFILAKKELEKIGVDVAGDNSVVEKSMSTPERTWELFKNSLKDQNYGIAYKCFDKEYSKKKYSKFEYFVKSYDADAYQALSKYSIDSTEYVDTNNAVITLKMENNEEFVRKIHFVNIDNMWLMTDGIKKDDSKKEDPKPTVKPFVLLPSYEIKVDTDLQINGETIYLSIHLQIIYDFVNADTPRTQANLNELNKAGGIVSSLLNEHINELVHDQKPEMFKPEKRTVFRKKIKESIVKQSVVFFDTVNFPGKVSKVIILKLANKKPVEK